MNAFLISAGEYYSPVSVWKYLQIQSNCVRMHRNACISDKSGPYLRGGQGAKRRENLSLEKQTINEYNEMMQK